MSRFAALAVLGLLWPSSQASAACHRFAVWHYPYPQSCHASRGSGLREASARRLPASAPAAPDRSYYVEITKLPDDPERDRALDELKRLMLH